MTTRRTGILSALLLTAALFACMPGLLRTALLPDRNRMAQVLRPPEMRMLTVWRIGSGCGDERLIAKACADFEKEHRGVRVFLRTAHAQELADERSVLPDAVLFETGSITVPEKVFLPVLDAAEPSALFAGVCYAVPLWLAPHVLSLPAGWVQEGAEELPWQRIVQPGALRRPEGVALQQLVCMCPLPFRRQLIAGLQQAQPNAQAQVRTLAAHQRAAQSEDLRGFVLAPAVSDRVRYAALCRDHEDARAFVRFLQASGAQQAGTYSLVSLAGEAPQGEGLLQQATLRFSGTRTLPNAFAHLKNEINALCGEAFLRGADPVETLLKLR